MVAWDGIEPSTTAYETVVLPLHHPAMCRAKEQEKLGKLDDLKATLS